MYSQENIERLFDAIGRQSGEGFTRTQHYDHIVSKGYAWPNLMLNLEAGNADPDGILDEIEHKAGQGVIPDLYMSDPGKANVHMLEKMRARGYAGGSWTAMTHSLKFLPDEESATMMLDISEVGTEEQMVAWLDITEAELMGGKSLSRALFRSLMHEHGFLFLLGYSDGVPVSTGLVFIHAETAGVYLIATDSNYRKRGFGKAMTLHCLHKALKGGVQRADIQATDAGYSVYKSLGFEDHGKIHVFRLRKSPS